MFQRPGGKSGYAPPDPVFQITVGKSTKQSQVIYRTDHPVFEKEFTFLVNNPETDTLRLKVCNYLSIRYFLAVILIYNNCLLLKCS